MARFYGVVGFVEQQEVQPYVFDDVITEHAYYGDVLRNSRRLEAGVGLVDNITVNNQISIIADAYAEEHFFNIRYVVWQGAKWKVSTAEVQDKRLLLTLGGIYTDE